MKTLRSIVAAALLAGAATSALAQGTTPTEQADARTKVQTAVALANIAMAEKDGEALLVAARMLASAGDVAKPDAQAAADGKPTLYDVNELVMAAKKMGADAAAADKIAAAKTGSTPTSGYWYYSCDSYNNCQWIYAGY